MDENNDVIDWDSFNSEPSEDSTTTADNKFGKPDLLGSTPTLPHPVLPVPTPPILPSPRVEVPRVEVPRAEAHGTITPVNPALSKEPTPLPNLPIDENTQIKPHKSDEDSIVVVQTTNEGEEVTTIVNLETPELTVEEAKELTSKIRSTTNILYLLIARAHKGKAYKALGYSSFAEYVREEFNYSRSYAYKLLDQAKVIEAVEAVVPEGTTVYISELSARSLKKVLPEIVAEVEERTANATPDEAVDIIEEIIKQKKEEQDSYKEFDEDFDPGFNEDDLPAEGVKKPSITDDDFFNDFDDDEYERFASGDDPRIMAENLSNLFELIHSIETLAKMKENSNLTTLVNLIPIEKNEDITSNLTKLEEFLVSFKELWGEHLSSIVPPDLENEDDSNNEEENEDSDFL